MLVKSTPYYFRTMNKNLSCCIENMFVFDLLVFLILRNKLLLFELHATRGLKRMWPSKSIVVAHVTLKIQNAVKI
jgi:hypothetical protein